jgi:ligand-binding sensor domain-containing protein
MKYIVIHTLFFVFIFCSSSKGQSKTELPKDDSKSEAKDVILFRGPNTSVRIIRQDRKGNIWLASNEGIIRYDGKLFTNITGGLNVGRFLYILEDKKGNFWFGNYNAGAFYYDGQSLQHFTYEEGLISNQINTIYEDKAGNIWFGGNGGVSQYDGQSFRNFKTEAGLDVMTIIEDKSGKLWFGTRGNIFVYDGKTFAVSTFNGTSFTDVWSIIEDKKGNTWLGGGAGLWRYDGNTFTNFTQHFVGYVYEDKKGNIWTSGSTDNNVFVISRYDGRSLSNKKPTVTEIKQSLNLFGILEANDTSIWFGAFDGVYRYDGNNTITDFKDKASQQ